MTTEKSKQLSIAINEASRFITRAKDALTVTECGPCRKHSAAVRASLDLSAQLSKFRKAKNY